MALSYVQYVGDGVTQTFAVPFEMLDPSHVEVRVALDIHEFTWDDPGTVRIVPAPFPGAVVEIRRHTPRDYRMVDFVDGSVLTESDLDLATKQTFFIVQEAIDIAGGTLELLADGSYGAGGRRIKEVGTPIEPRDAVTKEYHDGTFIPQMNALLAQSIAARDGAVTARGAAEAALAAAVAARDLALQYRDTTKGYRDEVNTWHSNVYIWHQNVVAKSDNVDAKAATVDTQAAQVAADRTATQGFRNEAETFKNAAAASAAAAATWDPANYLKRDGSATMTGPLVLQQGGRLYDQPAGTLLQVQNDRLNVLNKAGTSVLFTIDGAYSAPVWKDYVVWHSGNFDPTTALAGKVDKDAAITVSQSYGPWSTAGWRSPIKLSNGAAILWPNGSNTGAIGFSAGAFYILVGPEATNGTGSAATRLVVTDSGAWLNGHSVLHNGNIGGYIPSGIITAANFTNYFTMRRAAWGQTGYVVAGNFTGGNYAGPAGTFLTSIAIDAYLSHSGYYYYLQWYWNGTWYTVQG